MGQRGLIEHCYVCALPIQRADALYLGVDEGLATSAHPVLHRHEPPRPSDEDEVRFGYASILSPEGFDPSSPEIADFANHAWQHRWPDDI